MYPNPAAKTLCVYFILLQSKSYYVRVIITQRCVQSKMPFINVFI